MSAHGTSGPLPLGYALRVAAMIVLACLAVLVALPLLLAMAEAAFR